MSAAWLCSLWGCIIMVCIKWQGWSVQYTNMIFAAVYSNLWIWVRSRHILGDAATNTVTLLDWLLHEMLILPMQRLQVILASQDDAHEFGMSNLICFLVDSLHETYHMKRYLTSSFRGDTLFPSEEGISKIVLRLATMLALGLAPTKEIIRYMIQMNSIKLSAVWQPSKMSSSSQF